MPLVGSYVYIYVLWICVYMLNVLVIKPERRTYHVSLHQSGDIGMLRLIRLSFRLIGMELGKHVFFGEASYVHITFT